MDQSRLMIIRMDEIVSHKANKHTLDDQIEFTKTLAPIAMVLQKERESFDRYKLTQKEHVRTKEELMVLSNNI